MDLLAAIIFSLPVLLVLAMVDPLVGMGLVKVIDALGRRWKKED